ncbi:MAG: hypothetical protein ABSA46_01965 [Thermodesulfovibrionales bacterium]|jgi:siroheme synthase
MAAKIVRKGEGEEDILGLVAFGSLVANIFQIASKKSLEEEHAVLKAYASELKRHYENMKVRERLVYNTNLELKRANEGLIAVNTRLLKELVEARNEVIRLKGGSPETHRRRMRRVRRRTGGSQ